MRCSRRCEAKPWPKALAGLVFFVVAAVAIPAAAGDALAQNLTLPGDKDFILQIDSGDRWARLAVHTSIGGAFRRLASPECQKILSDFTDGDGRTLRDNLAATGQTAPGYLGLLRYADGTGQLPCARAGILAFTSPGNRIVYVCGRFRDRFLALRLQDRVELELGLIHEVLHTLGLGENPPTSQQITDRVRLRCDDK